jgi:hypothetical protein
VTTLSEAPSLFDALTEASSLFDAVDGVPALDETIAGVWEGLADQRVVECPVCQEAMEPEYSTNGRPIGGRCRACGSSIS